MACVPDVAFVKEHVQILQLQCTSKVEDFYLWLIRNHVRMIRVAIVVMIFVLGVGVKLNCIAKEEFSGADTFYNGKIGYYRKCFTGYSNSYNVRYHSASGGMVTQLLVWMLEKKLIDGAAVTAFSSKSELLVHSFIATTKEEILFAKSSKYAPVTLNNIIHDIKAREGEICYCRITLPYPWSP